MIIRLILNSKQEMEYLSNPIMNLTVKLRKSVNLVLLYVVLNFESDF